MASAFVSVLSRCAIMPRFRDVFSLPLALPGTFQAASPTIVYYLPQVTTAQKAVKSCIGTERESHGVGC